MVASSEIKTAAKPGGQAEVPSFNSQLGIMLQGVYIVRPAIFAPAILTLVAIVFSIRESWWFLASLPFIWLGSVSAQPNLNLANGCLAYLAMLVGFGVLALFRPLGIAIIVGAMSGFYLSAIEKRIRMRRASDV